MKSIRGECGKPMAVIIVSAIAILFNIYAITVTCKFDILKIDIAKIAEEMKKMEKAIKNAKDPEAALKAEMNKKKKGKKGKEEGKEEGKEGGEEEEKDEEIDE